jgi:hypothetical protein
MGYRPPKGVRPPQLDGKRTGRPKGSRNWASAFEHCFDETAAVPRAGAGLWWYFALEFPDDVEQFLFEYGML